MFSSSYFNPEYFGEYFKISGKVIPPDHSGKGGGVEVDLNELSALGLQGDESEILEFIVAFVLSQ